MAEIMEFVELDTPQTNTTHLYWICIGSISLNIKYLYYEHIFWSLSGLQ